MVTKKKEVKPLYVERFNEANREVRKGNRASNVGEREAHFAEGYQLYRSAYKLAPKGEKARILEKMRELGAPPDIYKERHDLGYTVATTWGIFAISALVLSLVSISFNLTGFAVSNPNSTNNPWGWLSIGLFILGLAFTLFHFRFKRKK